MVLVGYHDFCEEDGFDKLLTKNLEFFRVENEFWVLRLALFFMNSFQTGHIISFAILRCLSRAVAKMIRHIRLKKDEIFSIFKNYLKKYSFFIKKKSPYVFLPKGSVILQIWDIFIIFNRLIQLSKRFLNKFLKFQGTIQLLTREELGRDRVHDIS